MYACQREERACSEHDTCSGKWSGHMEFCHLSHSCYAAMHSIALSQRVGVEVIFRLAASQLATLLYAVPARAAPHANLGHANNNTVSQSTTRQLQDFFHDSNISPSLVDSDGPRLQNRLRIDPNNSCYIGVARLAGIWYSSLVCREMSQVLQISLQEPLNHRQGMLGHVGNTNPMLCWYAWHHTYTDTHTEQCARGSLK